MGASQSRFRRIRPLGRGGTAEVTAVKVKGLACEAALKMPLSDNPDSYSQFSRLARRESLLIGNERFPGLVRLLEPPTDKADYLLLEICEGPSLDKVGRIENLPLALNILSAIALDLEFLHARRIIHGDLKPHNIFLPLRWQGCTGARLFYVKISDFSLGRFESESESERAGAGTVGYMAPETIVAGRTSHRSDLFALGVIAYQMLTGQHPFLEGDAEPVRVNAWVAEEEPIPLDRLRPDLPPGLIRLIGDLLAKQEENRPADAWEVCSQLRELGAEYPYERALLPSHLVARSHSYECALATTVTPDRRQRERLDLITGEDTVGLRLVLAENFRQGGLHYKDQRFVFVTNIYWPSTLRRKVLRVFSALPMSGKRWLIRASVAGDHDIIGCTQNQTEENPSRLNAGAKSLLLHLLRNRTVKRIAAVCAPRAEAKHDYLNAARLALMAGDFERAERCACHAAEDARTTHAFENVLPCLARVVEYADTVGDPFAARNLLMAEGDILKEMGESDKALQTYQRIVWLYEGRPPDKLLAETYKDIGDTCKIRQEVLAGIEALQSALEIYRKLEDELEVSHTQNNLGNLYWIKSDLPGAMRFYRAAMRIQRRLDAAADVASTLNNIASVYVVQTKYPRAARLLKLSLDIKMELGNAVEIARAMNNLGYVYYVSGRLENARETLVESMKINVKIGAKKEILFNLENLAFVTFDLGTLAESIRYVEEGLTLALDLQDKPHLAVFNLILCGAHTRSGRFSDAAQSLRAARSSLDQIDAAQFEAFYHAQHAALRLAVGDYHEALECGLEAMKRSIEIGDRHMELRSLLIVTRISSDHTYAEKLRAIVEELKLEREQRMLEFNNIERQINEQQTIPTDLPSDESAAFLQSATEDVDLPRMCNLFAEVLIARKKLNEASVWLNKSVRCAQESGLVPEFAAAVALQGRLEGLSGKIESCYAKSRQALDLVKELAANCANDEDRGIFLSRREVTTLVNEVRRLGTAMGQKLRAE